jgi:inorganic pyrophosphatase
MALRAVIEMPRGTDVKYEVSKSDGSLLVDRILNQGVPSNYGYIEGTMAGDGDPLDIFIINDSIIYPKSKTAFHVVGGFFCVDNGAEDNKIVAIVEGSSMEIGQIARAMHLIERYLSTYKKGFEVKEPMTFGQAEEEIVKNLKLKGE